MPSHEFRPALRDNPLVPHQSSMRMTAPDASTPSINAVAKLAGVSIATVSRVINNSKNVNEGTRRRVEDAIEELGYRVNVFGRSLRRSESRSLMVLVPDLANPYFAEIIRGIESVARSRRYNLLLAHSTDDVGKEGGVLEGLYNRTADGVISLVHIHQSQGMVETVQALPWVSCSECLPDGNVPFVAVDHRQGALDAVQYLLNRKHRRIGFIGCGQDQLWSQQRLAGYEAALRRAEIPLNPDYVRFVGNTDFQEGQRATSAFLALEHMPTAICAASDTLAIGAIKGFKQAGLRVPEDVAVVGFDDVPIARVYEPALTTIAQPMQQLGETAALMMIERLEGRTVKSQILPHTLMVRESA